MYNIIKKLIGNINNPPSEIKRKQIWRIPRKSVYLLVMYTDEEFARVIPLMKRIDVNSEVVSRYDVMFSCDVVSVLKFGVVAFVRKALMVEKELILRLTYIGELDNETFKIIHYCDHNDYSFIDNKKCIRADLGMILKNEN